MLPFSWFLQLLLLLLLLLLNHVLMTEGPRISFHRPSPELRRIKKRGDRRCHSAAGKKDRHSKVSTSKGPRDRRVRLSASTAIQFYDVQDRLGYDRPSKAVDWLMEKAKSAIDALAQLPSPPPHHRPQEFSDQDPMHGSGLFQFPVSVVPDDTPADPNSGAQYRPPHPTFQDPSPDYDVINSASSPVVGDAPHWPMMMIPGMSESQKTSDWENGIQGLLFEYSLNQLLFSAEREPLQSTEMNPPVSTTTEDVEQLQSPAAAAAAAAASCNNP